MRALVIGADGFAGRWLVKHLNAAGDSVVGLAGSRFRPPLEGAERVEQLDVRDEKGLSALVEAVRPDAVYYLAGVSSQEEREDVSVAVGVSVVGSMNALIASARLEPHPRLLFVSTGYVYRAASEPLDERSPTEPDTIYAAAKLAAEHALLAVGPAAGVDVVIARPFNHIGPGQSESFLVPTMARQAVSGGGGTREIRVADASVVRDFTDVRDVVAAYRLLMERARCRLGPQRRLGCRDFRGEPGDRDRPGDRGRRVSSRSRTALHDIRHPPSSAMLGRWNGWAGRGATTCRRRCAMCSNT